MTQNDMILLPTVRLYINPKNNVTNSGPTAAIFEHRRLIQNAVLHSNQARKMIWSALETTSRSYQLNIAVKGYTIDHNDKYVKPYFQSMAVLAAFGGDPVYQATQDAIDNFRSIKKDFNAPRYVSNNLRLIINEIEVSGYEYLHRGGGGKRIPPEPKYFTTDLCGKDANQKLDYGDSKPGSEENNNCALRALCEQMVRGVDKKWFKKNFNLRTIRKEFGLPPNCKLSPEDVIRMCESRKIQVKITIVTGTDPNTATTSVISSTATDYTKAGFELILHTDVEHYYLPASGLYRPGTSKMVCPDCGDVVKSGSYVNHQSIHSLRNALAPSLTTPVGPIERQPDEDLQLFSARYLENYINIIHEFCKNKESSEILFFAGPGGCGKSRVINVFKERNTDMKILCLAKTGVASQNIGGITLDSFLIKYEQGDKYDLIILDEISFVSSKEFDRLDRHLRKLHDSERSFGGVKLILMGDFLQLQPYGDDKPSVFSTSFICNVRIVPMLYGFRYSEDPEFYKLLLQLRSDYVPRKDFLRAGFNMTTLSKWITTFNYKNRPTLLVSTNVIRRKLEEDARAYDLHTNPHLVQHHFSLSFTRIQMDPNGKKLGIISKHTGFPKGWFVPAQSPGDDETFSFSVSHDEFDCEINTTRTSFYHGERLMILKNKCDDEKTLMNGNEVTFYKIEKDDTGTEFMVVRDMNGTLRSIPKVERGCKSNGGFYLAKGFPVHSALTSTVHKAQGKTFQNIVVDIPLPDKRVRNPHQYYVAISRCVSAKNVSFMVRNISKEEEKLGLEGLDLVHRRLYDSTGGGRQLVSMNKVMIDLMKYSETGGLMLECPYLDQFTTIQDSIYFPNCSNAVYWKPSLPNKVDTVEIHRSFLGKELIVFDIETGAGVNHEHHPAFYDCDDNFISDSNSMRHIQTPWLISFLHIREWRIVWIHEILKDPEIVLFQHTKTLLLELSKLQDPNTGIVHIQLDRDDNDYCSIMFTEYLLFMCGELERKKTSKLRNNKRKARYAKLSRYDHLPITLVGYNSDSFDSKSVLGALEKVELPNGYVYHVTPNSGTAITRFSIRNDDWANIGDLLASHDLFRYMGCQPSLAQCHSTYMGKKFGSDVENYTQFCENYTHDTILLRNLGNHLVLGKSEFPHLLTQRDGYRPTLSNELVTYKLEDYPEQMRDEVKSVESRTFRMFSKAREYMNGDIYVLLGAYIGANEINAQTLRVPILSLNTAQQKTTANFIYTGSDIEGLIVKSGYDDNFEKCNFTTKMSLPDPLTQHFIDLATYGGKTLARAIEWNSDEGSGSYNQVDESGMYADAQEKCNYPYGAHYFTTLKKYCDAVQKTFDIMQDGRETNDPYNAPLPHMYIADVTIQIPSLCIDSYIPFVNDKEQLDWGICNNVSTNGIRRQVLSSIHLGTLKDMGGKLLTVHAVVIFEKYGPIYKKYLSKLNLIKYTTKDPVEKQEAKLDANANYGASMKRDQDTLIGIVKGPEETNAFLSKMDRNHMIYSRALYDGRVCYQGHIRPDLRKYSSRPTYMGTFVLAHSQFKLGRMARIGFGDTHVPKTLDQAREGLINQPLYGDTDSLFLHDTHIARLLKHAEVSGERFLHDNTLCGPSPTNKEKLDKLGKYCDEVANDYGCGDLVDYKNGIFTKVTRFAAAGPKAYTASYITPNGQVIHKNRLKGVKNGATIAAFDNPEDKKRLLEQSDTRYSKKSKSTADEMYRTITTGGMTLATYKPQTLKLTGCMPQRHEISMDNDYVQSRREAHSFSATSVSREVLGEILTRRRQLTAEEVGILELSEYDAERILVPNGWNWDRSLFTLV